MKYLLKPFDEVNPKVFAQSRPMMVVFTGPENPPIIAELTEYRISQDPYPLGTKVPAISVEAEGNVILTPDMLTPDDPRFPRPLSDNIRHKKIIFGELTTTVLWEDGTVTVVKAAENESFDREKGVAVAFMKKALGNGNAHNKILRKDAPEADKQFHERVRRRIRKDEKKAAAKAAKARNEMIRESFKPIINVFTNLNKEADMDATESDS